MYTELRRIYSGNSITLNLEQREFGLISEARKKISRMISRSITKDSLKKDELSEYLTNHKNLVNDKDVESKLSDIAKNKYKSGILRFNGGLKDEPLHSSTVNTKLIKKKVDPSKLNGREKELAESIIDNDNVIFYPKGAGVEQLAHEIGHVKNRTEGLYNRAISKLSNKFHYNPKSSSTKNFIKGKLMIEEEKNASKNAMRLLKDSGMSDSNLRRSKENLDKGIEIYRLGNNIKGKSRLMKMIEVKKKDKKK